MKDLGQVLKNERIAKGMTIEEVADMTKISVRYLHSIENNDLSALPGKFYIKGFIRNYAKAIGFDVEPYLSDTDDSEKEEEANVTPNIKSTTSAPVRERKFGRLFALSLVVVLLALIVVTIYKFYESDREVDGPYDNNTEIEAIDEIEPLPVKPTPDDGIEIDSPKDTNSTSKISIERKNQDGITDYNVIEGVNNFKLLIDSADGSCWYELREVNNMGEIISSQSFRLGDSYEITLSSGFWLRLGNPDAVKIYINDVLVDKDSVKQPRNYQFDIN